MRLLKFFLWITLLACVAWGAAIFLGPTAISRAVAVYFGDAVKLQRLQHLQATIEANVRRISAGRVGTVQRILVEGPSRCLGLRAECGKTR